MLPFDVPDSVSAVGLFGGAFVLAALAVAGLADVGSGQIAPVVLAIAAYAAHWRTGEPLRAEYRMLARDGSEVWVRDEAFALPGDESGHQVSQGLLIDTTDRKRLESQLIHDALHDPLTGLANRVLLHHHLQR